MKKKENIVLSKVLRSVKTSIPYFLTKFELNNLVSGSLKELELHAQTV